MRNTLTALAVAAAATFALAVPAHAATTPPDEVVKTATEQLQAEIRARQKEFRADPAKFYAVIETMVAPHFDQRYIAQLILARHWKTASEDQRTRFQNAFKNMLIRSYGNALLEYGDEVKTEWKPVRMGADAKEVTVESKVIRPSGNPVPMGFAMRLSGDAWKVYDITIENISLITGFRSQVASSIKTSSIDAVIQKLEAGQTLAAPTKTQ